MDFVTPLYNTLNAQAVLDQHRAVTEDTKALGLQRLMTTQIMQNKLKSDELTRSVLSQFAAGINPNTDPSTTVMPDDPPEVASQKTAKAAQMSAQRYRSIAGALQAAGADPQTTLKYEQDAINQNFRAEQSSREAAQLRLQNVRAAAAIAASVRPDDEDSFNIAVNRLDPQLVKGLPFDRNDLGQPIITPRSYRVMQTVAAQGRTAQEQAALEEKVAADKARVEAKKATEAKEAAEIKRIDSQTALNQTRAKVLENPPAKATAPVKPKPITPANSKDREAADSAIDAEDFSDKGEKWEPAARRAFAADIADRAKKYQISASNKGDELSMDDARQMAIDDLKGNVQGKEVSGGFFSIGKQPKVITYKRGGAAPTESGAATATQAPLPLPPGAKPADLANGNVYQTAKGLGRWNAEKQVFEKP